MSATPILDILTVLDPNQPLLLGQVKLNREGVLELSQGPLFPQRAQFTWQGAPVQVSLHQIGARIVCDIVADLGMLPFSAQNPELRGMLLAILRGFQAPVGCQLMLAPRQIIWACQQTDITGPLKPATILAEVAVFIHRMSPIIELITDIQRAYGSGQPPVR